MLGTLEKVLGKGKKVGFEFWDLFLLKKQKATTNFIKHKNIINGSTKAINLQPSAKHPHHLDTETNQLTTQM